MAKSLYVQRSILDSLKCRPPVNLYSLWAPLLAYLVLHLRWNGAKTRSTSPENVRCNVKSPVCRRKSQCTCLSSHTESHSAQVLGMVFNSRAKHKGKEAHGCSRQCRRARRIKQKDCAHAEYFSRRIYLEKRLS